jgi:hypothetical protein
MSPVDEKFYEETKGKGAKDTAEQLTAHWNVLSAKGSTTAGNITNRKLHVRHVVDASSLGNGGESGSGSGSIGGSPSTGYGSVSANGDLLRDKLQNASGSSGNGGSDPSPEQMFSEVSQLRKRYEELVAFSVNLTAERDILNNALEQAKRDLQKEMQARMQAEEAVSQGKGGSNGGSKDGDMRGRDGKGGAQVTVQQSAGFSFFTLLVLALIMFGAGKFGNELVALITGVGGEGGAFEL